MLVGRDGLSLPFVSEKRLCVLIGQLNYCPLKWVILFCYHGVDLGWACQAARESPWWLLDLMKMAEIDFNGAAVTGLMIQRPLKSERRHC
ncbi:hypothetical protein ACLOJK_034452, partial [Asimina triloba]